MESQVYWGTILFQLATFFFLFVIAAAMVTLIVWAIVKRRSKLDELEERVQQLEKKRTKLPDHT